MQGTITDATGAVLPKAKVEISGGALVQPVSIESNNSGYFSTSAVPPGT